MPNFQVVQALDDRLIIELPNGRRISIARDAERFPEIEAMVDDMRGAQQLSEAMPGETAASLRDRQEAGTVARPTQEQTDMADLILGKALVGGTPPGGG